jgi:hypothetical protein
MWGSNLPKRNGKGKRVSFQEPFLSVILTTTKDKVHDDDRPRDNDEEDIETVQLTDSEDDDSLSQDDLNKPASTSLASGNAVVACTLYSFCSMSMVLVNKSLSSR